MSQTVFNCSAATMTTDRCPVSVVSISHVRSAQFSASHHATRSLKRAGDKLIPSISPRFLPLPRVSSTLYTGLDNGQRWKLLEVEHAYRAYVQGQCCAADTPNEARANGYLRWVIVHVGQLLILRQLVNTASSQSASSKASSIEAIFVKHVSLLRTHPASLCRRPTSPCSAASPVRSRWSMRKQHDGCTIAI